MKSTGNPWQLLNRLRSPFRIEVDGLDQLPVGGLILAVNRVGPHDHLYVAASLGRPATVVVGGPPARGRFGETVRTLPQLGAPVAQ